MGVRIVEHANGTADFYVPDNTGYPEIKVYDLAAISRAGTTIFS